MLIKTISRLRSIYIYLLLIFTTLISGISFLPFKAYYPNTDSGIFLYMGQQILNGSILYRDLWDNKGPVLYYINALALLIGGGSIWGLYFIEFLSLLIAVAMGYLVMEKAFSRIPAIFASIIWPLALFYVGGIDSANGGGNFTEEYALPFSFAALYLFLRSRNSSSSTLYIFLIGVVFSLSFLLRPNNTGMQISVALVIFISGVLTRSFYMLVKQILAYALGSIVVLIAVVLYFQWMNALGDFYDSFIRYNYVYSSSTLSDRISSLLFGLRLLSPTGLPLIAIAAWIIGVCTIINRPNWKEWQTALLSAAVIGLPVEFVLSSTSGLTYFHYYICWLPVFAILTSFFIFGLITNFSSTRVNLFKRKINLSHIWVLGLFIAMSGLALVKAPRTLEKFISSSKQKSPIVEEIRKSMKGEKYLLIWGTDSYFNFVTKMKSPTRYFHQLPFYVCAYRTDKMIEEFLDDIIQKKPLIVDMSPNTPFVLPLDKNERKKWKYVEFTDKKNESCTMSPKMEEVLEYIDSRYKLVDTIEVNKWRIYQFDDDKQKS